MDVRPDLEADLLTLDFPPETVDEIRLHHVFEHFNRVTALALLIRWHEWLKLGGLLHIETPDLVGSAETLLSDEPYEVKAGVARHLAGDQTDEWAYHVDHWFPARFDRTLKELGYTSVEVSTIRWDHPPFLSSVVARAKKLRAIDREKRLAAADRVLLDSTVAASEKPSWEIWKLQLRQVLAGRQAARASNLPTASPRSTAVGGLIVSKDRPLQLQAVLDSYRRHCVDPELAELTVLFLASNKRQSALYTKVAMEHPTVKFLAERSFRDDVRSALVGTDHYLFLVDDTLFVRGFSLVDQIQALERHPSALGFSLRLGSNTTYSYSFNRPQGIPTWSAAEDGILAYEWTKGDADFGYPLELSSSLYRASDLRDLLSELSYGNPNTLEAALARGAAKFAGNKPELLCYEKSVAFSTPLNVVQEAWKNRSGNKADYSAEALADRFAGGFRVDVSAYDGFVPNACHQEVELKLHRPCQ
jgi:hypothetical protein